MAFYDEDDFLGDIPEYDRSIQGPESKRLRLEEPGPSWAGEYPRSVFDETLDKPDTIDGDDDDDECNAEEVEARLRILRQIGHRTHPRVALRKYLLKVMQGKELNPWVSTVRSERDLRKMLRWYVLGMMVRACKDEGVEVCEVEESHTDALKFVDRLNAEIIESVIAVGTFSSEQVRCARNNCQKAFLPRRLSGALVSRIHGNYTCCQVPECTRSIENNDQVNYLIVEGGCYSARLEIPEFRESTSKLLCFCTFHNGLYELMFELIHMKWNVYHNCVVHVRKVLENKKCKDSDEVIDELPTDVVRTLVHHYMARYFCFWAFGDTAMWSKNGCTLFQLIAGD